jgi:CubicO group peptidase (beta-lactamase class C family)
MAHTRVAAEGLVQGHDGDLVAVRPWDFGALVGAGGLHSTANDLLAFLGQSLGFVASPLGPVLQASQAPQSAEMAFGWHLTDDGTTLWHDGQTAGFHSFLALDPQRQLGVVVLSDTSTAVVNDVGLVLLGKLDAPRLRATEQLSTYVLDQWVGRYRLERNVFLEVTREGDHLVLNSPGEPPARLYAENAIDFYLRVSDVRITFNEDGLVLHRADGDVTARRARR